MKAGGNSDNEINEVTSYESRDLILYALGVGASVRTYRMTHRMPILRLVFSLSLLKKKTVSKLGNQRQVGSSALVWDLLIPIVVYIVSTQVSRVTHVENLNNSQC